MSAAPMLVLFSTGGRIAHAADLSTLSPVEQGGTALCGADGFADRLGQQPLRLTPQDDQNVTCRRCVRSRVWRAASLR